MPDSALDEPSPDLPAAPPLADAFALEPPTAKSRRRSPVKYNRRYEDYAADLGITAKNKDAVRVLKRWVSIGAAKSPPDYPPFDDFPALAEWWRRNMAVRVPEYLLDLEAPAGNASPTPSQPPSEPPAKEGYGPLQPINLGGDAGGDMGLDQVRALVSSTFAALQQAVTSNNQQRYDYYFRKWTQTNQILRQWEKESVKIQEARGEVLRSRVISTELTSIFTVTAQSFTNVLEELAAKLAPDLDASNRRAMAIEYRDRCFVHLHRTRFADAWSPISSH